MILKVIRGSIAYGTDISGKDVDIGEVYVADLFSYVGLNNNRQNKHIIDGKNDTASFEVLNFIKGVCAGNPNMVEMVFTPAEFVLDKTYEGELLLEAKSVLLSKQAYFPYKGFATAELHRLSKTNDPKAAHHALRIIRQGVELLSTGFISVNRSKIDADLLKKIKRGDFKKEYFLAMAEEELSVLEEAFKNSPLSEHVDIEKVNELAAHIVLHRLKR